MSAVSKHDVVLQRASAAIQHNRPDEAERLARQVLHEDAGELTALHLLGCALLVQRRPAEAVEPLEAAARGRRDSTIETQLAIALRQTGRIEDALAKLKRAIKREPPCPAAFHELGSLLFSLERFDDAAVVVQQGMRAAPWMLELPVLLGGILGARRDRAGAKAAYAGALTVAPDHPAAHFGMGCVLQDEADFANAAQHFRQALRADPHDAQARLRIAACLLELGQADDALSFLQTAVRAVPQAYGAALKIVSSSARGRFWLRPSAAARVLR